MEGLRLLDGFLGIFGVLVGRCPVYWAMKALSAVLVMALAGSAYAAPDVDCPKVYKPRKKKVKRKPPPKETKCDCPAGPEGPRGEQGPPGDRGPKGDPGESKVVHVRDGARFPLVGGVFANYFANGDWAWGPALQLAGLISENYQATLLGGLAMGATDGRESGYTVRAGVERVLADRTTLGVGLGHLSIDGSPSNGNISGDYLTLDVGISVSRDVGPATVRLNLQPIVIGFLNDTKGDSIEVGSSASLLVGARF